MGRNESDTGETTSMRIQKFKTTAWLIILLIGLFTLTLCACGSGGGAESSGEPVSGSGSLAVKVSWPDAPRSAASSSYTTQDADMNCEGLSTVEIQVYGPPPTNTLLAGGGPWECQLGQGQVNDIPATNDCTVVLIAKNTEGQIEFHGIEENVNIVAGQTTQADIIAESFVPELTSPTDSSPQPSVLCEWNEVTGAHGYDLRLSTNPNMSLYTTTATQATAKIPEGVSAGVTYYCQVAAKDAFGNISDGSNILAFSVSLGSPTLIFPAQGAVVLSGDINCNWEGPGEDLAYHLTVATNSQLDTPWIDRFLPPNTTSFLLSDLVIGQTYYWQVTTLDAEGRPGPPSEKFNFTPGEAVMQLIEPLNGTVFSKEDVTLAWDTVSLPDTQYRVTLSTVEDPDNPIDRVTTTDAFFTSNKLEDGINYVWQVERLNSSGVATHISPRWQFATLVKPLLTAPGDNVTRVPGNFEFEWQNVPNNGYQIIIASDQALTQTIFTDVTDPDTNIYQSGMLPPGQTYYWRIWPQDSENAVHDAYASEEIRSIKTLGTPPILAAPSDGMTIVRSGFAFSWSAVTNSAGYTLYVSENSSPQQSPAIQISQPGTGYHLSDLSLQNGTRYYWQVVANDPVGSQGAGSNIFNFQTVVSNQAELAVNPDAFNYAEVGNFFFSTRVESGNSYNTLWRTDIAGGNAVRVNGVQDISSLTVIDQALYFAADTDASGDRELCRITDPATASALKIAGTDNLNPTGVIKVGDRVFFYTSVPNDIYNTGRRRYTLWQFVASDSAPSAVSVYPDGGAFLAGVHRFFAGPGNMLYFEGDVSDRFDGNNWVLLKNIFVCRPPYNTAAILVNMGLRSDLVALDSIVIFAAYFADNHGYEIFRRLYSSDGYNFSAVKDICPGPPGRPVASLTRKGENFYFFADENCDDNNYDRHLWRTDGTESGTIPIDHPTTEERIIHRSDSSAQIVNLNDTLYFRAVDSTYGDELRRSDGTFEGTQVVLDIWPGPTGSENRDDIALEYLQSDFIIKYDNSIYFRSTEPTYGSNTGEIWKTDGTPQGTEVIEAFTGPPSSYPMDYKIKYIGGVLYFTAGDDFISWNREVWQYVP